MRHSQSDNTELDYAYYAFDALGNPTRCQSRDGTCTWTYDNLDQLIAEERPGAVPVTWSYDPARRRVGQQSAAGLWTYTYDAADQLRTLAYDSGLTTYTYDPTGNRVSREAPDATRTTYTWDPQDRLTALEFPGGARYTHAYRHDSLRHSREDATGRQTFLYDGRDVLAVEGVNARRFARGAGLARNLGDGLGQVFHLDAMGTVQALSAADGSEVTRYGTDPWGKVLSGSAAGNAYVYHGGLGYWEDPGAGLSYVRARWLEPETGNWLSVDPVSGEPRYVYARQMPTRLVDPAGTQTTQGVDLDEYLEKTLQSGKDARFRLPPIAHWPPDRKIAEAIRRAIELVPQGVGKQLAALLSPESAAVVAAVVILWAGSHFLGVGEIADVILVIVGYVAMGGVALEAGEKLVKFAVVAAGAKSNADLDVAARHLADAVSLVGVQVISALLLKKL